MKFYKGKYVENENIEKYCEIIVKRKIKYFVFSFS